MADNNVTNDNTVDAVTAKLQNTTLNPTNQTNVPSVNDQSPNTNNNQNNNNNISNNNVNDNNNTSNNITTTNVNEDTKIQNTVVNNVNVQNNNNINQQPPQQQQQQQVPQNTNIINNNNQNVNNNNMNNSSNMNSNMNNNNMNNNNMNNNMNNNNNNQNDNNNNNNATTTQQQDDKTNLIINYLPPTMSEGTLATLFSPYGSMERCKIVVDLQTLRSRGYGFVKYDNPDSAERALQALNGYELNGKKLKVAFARPQCKAITNANLYITNVPPHFIDDNLRKLFQDYGKIVECRVLMDQNGQSRGVGFVRMNNHHNAIQALQAMDQYVIDDQHPPLLVKLAQRRVPRRYWNAQQNRPNNNNQNQNQNQNNNQNNYNQQNQQQHNRKKKKGSPRRYYPKYNNQMNPSSGITDINQMSGGAMSGNNMRGSPSKRGYYRPRNQSFKPNQQKPQYIARRGPNSGGAPYFPAPMYDTPYISQYPQSTYPNINNMTAAAHQITSNPSAVGPKRNKPYSDWGQ